MTSKTESYVAKVREFNKEKERIKSIEKNIQFQYPFVSVLCLSCGTLAFSFSQHQMGVCDCGKTKVDGGSPSFMRIIGDLDKMESIYPCKIQNKILRKKYKEFQNKGIELINMAKELNEEKIRA